WALATPTPTPPPRVLAMPTPTPSPWALTTPSPTPVPWIVPSPAPSQAVGGARDWREMYGVVSSPTPGAEVPEAPPARPVAPPAIPEESAPRRRSGHRVVVLDPGHGGKDPGAQGLSDVEEKRITLAIARLTAARLRKIDPTIKVLLTRGGDSYVALKDRTAYANAKGADLFVSIHVNAAENDESSGIETYTLNNSNDRATKRLAAMENGLSEAGIEREDKDLAWIVSDLLQTGKEGESIALADSLQRETLRAVRRRWADTESLGVKKGPFFVLVGAYMPCALVETGFLTNRRESSRLGTVAYQEALADGIARGIESFLASGEANSNL
ncbi:MAG: N-acetylmuramoyl-L-alanine amidase, partial [Alphaproteobacteria bacterium]